MPEWSPPTIAILAPAGKAMAGSDDWIGAMVVELRRLSKSAELIVIRTGRLARWRFSLTRAGLARRLRAQGVQAVIGLGAQTRCSTRALASAGLAAVTLLPQASPDSLPDQGAEARAWKRPIRAQAIDALAQVGLLERVSVVVPNYNYERFIAERLSQIDRQHHPVWEIIVLDDASTDGSVTTIIDVAERLAAPVRLVRNAQNSGSVFRQWALGASLATGDLLWIAEADDRARPAFLSTLAGAFTRSTLVMAQCQSSEIDEAGDVRHDTYGFYLAEVGAERWTRPFTATGEVYASQALSVMNTTPNVSAVLFRVHVFRDVLAQEAARLAGHRLAGDWLVYLEMLARGDFHFTPEVLNEHRVHGGSVTHGDLDGPSRVLEVARVQREARNRFPVDATTRAAALAYLQKLYAYYVSDPPGPASVRDDPAFAEVLDDLPAGVA